MTKQNNKQTNRLLSMLSAVFLLVSVTTPRALAVPSTAATNLQTSAGVNTALTGNTLTITAPNKSVLTWQAFGSGADSIAVGDTISYALPSNSSSVLNVVAGGARTQIDGAISSNGNVFVLNPNGVIIGGGARIDTNAFAISTSGDAAFANYYFQQNGKLPIQDGLGSLAGSTSVATGAIINVTDNISIYSKNVDIAGALFSQGNLKVYADGAVALGSAGLTYINGNITVSNPTGTTTLGSAGNTLNSGGNVIVTSTSGTIVNGATSSFIAKAVTANAGTGDVSLGKVTSNTVTASGNNVAVALSSTVNNPLVNVAAAGNASVTTNGSLTVNLTNDGTVGTTTVAATGTLTLGAIHVNNSGATAFTGASIADSVNNNFVYGPVSFTATAGDVAILKTGNSFGPVSVSATGNATVNEGAALNLAAINAPKVIAASKDYVFQTGALTTPSLTLTSPKTITLSNAGNAIAALTVTGTDVTVVNTGAIALGNVTATGNLSLSTTGAITQSADAKIKSVGATTFIGTGLTATNAGNSFGALTLDVGAAGILALTEETTLNVAALRAGSATFKSLASVITTGVTPVIADTLSFEAAADVILQTNVRATNAITVKAGNLADLSLLSFSTNLNNKYPSITAASVKTPTP